MLELLITVAVAALILALTALSFQAMLMNNRLSAQVGALATAVNYAHSIGLSLSGWCFPQPILRCQLSDWLDRG